jgi:hypothetical protein
MQSENTGLNIPETQYHFIRFKYSIMAILLKKDKADACTENSERYQKKTRYFYQLMK